MSSPSGTAPTRRAPGEIRGAILEAARALFRDQGYDKTSTRQIARRAGTTSTTLFRHFGSKAALHAEAAAAGGTAVTDEPVSTRRPNRTETETRALLIAAATELFAAQGYAGTSTSQIAERAGVAEVALFRYFENKANLFRVAIFDPLGALIRHYAEQWNDADVPGLSHIVSDDFMHTFYNSMIEHRDSLMTLFTTRIHESPDVTAAGDQQAAMSEILGPLERAIRREIDPGRYPGVDVTIATRLTIAMIGGTVFFKDWLFPNDQRISDDLVINEMQRYIRAAIARER
jgi:AcrR family transcriptional regulator